jgi:two-component system chemotaxis response regulator CheB
VVRGPTENGHRPSVDVLFRSAARYGGERAVGVVLSGLLDDGTSGLAAIKRRGGLSIVQDPADAIFRGMPQSAIDNVEIDHIQPVSEIGTLLATVARTPIKRTDKKENSVSLSELNRDLATACMEPDALDAGGHPGAPSPYSCPDCGGVLWEIPEGETFRFRCRTGHAYSSRILLTKQSVALDEALWTALRALEESGDLAARLSARAQQRGHAISADRFAHQAASARERAEIVRQVLLRPDPELMDETRR